MRKVQIQRNRGLRNSRSASSEDTVFKCFMSESVFTESDEFGGEPGNQAA
jgi:hypothetical protein